VAEPLAVDGGLAVRSRPIRSATALTDEDIAAATTVLASGVLAGPEHPEVRRFESLLAESCGVAHAVAVNSGTAAIHCILLALGVGPGDEVIVPAHTFIATATPVLMAGATPVVVDVDDRTHCIDPAAVDAATSARTKAVVAVHINGHPAPVDQLPAGIPVVSDACQAHGARLFGTSVGALGAAAAFSFWQDKLVTAGGEGGAVVTDDAAVAETVRLVRSHAQQQIPGTPNAHHVSLGYNYRLTGAQAAIGHSQLSRLPGILQARRHNAGLLAGLLADVAGITLPVTRAGASHVYWRFVIALDPGAFRVGLGDIVRALRAEGIAAAPRYPIPLSMQPVMIGEARITPCPVAESLSDRLIMLPLPATVDDAEDVEDVATAVRKVVAAFGP
jgi:perosamine synthetase